MNLGSSNNFKEAFPDIIPWRKLARPLVMDPVIKDPNWVAGMLRSNG
jgi:hypothetical protein